MMKKVFLLLFPALIVLSTLGIGRAEAFTPNINGTWYCQNGLPKVGLSWGDYSNQGYTVSKYFVRKNGIVVATLYPPTQEYVDTNVTYNTNYRYILEAEATPTTFAAVDGGDITTGSCMYVSSISGPSSVTEGDSASYSGTYVWGSNNAATYSLTMKDKNGNQVGYGGAGLFSSPSTKSTTFSSFSASLSPYQFCATGSIPGDGLSDSRCKTVTVDVVKSVSLFVDGGKSVTKTKGQNASMTWQCIGTTSGCNSSVTTGQAVTGWSGGLLQAATNNSGLSIGPFNDTTTNGGVHTLKLEFNPSDTVTVIVNEPQQAVLNVNSSGASNVPITGLSGAPGGTTNPTSYSYTSTSNITGTLLAQQYAPNGAEFTGWGGDCSSKSGYTCSVNVPTGSIKTVTVYYSTPVPSQPNLRISSISMSPTSPSEGQAVTFSATVVNDGDSSAGGNSTTQLKIDLNDNGGGSLWDQTSNKTTGNLASGGTEVETWNNVWTAVTGTHRIRVCADNGGAISESNESDNCTDTYVTVGTTPPPPPPPESNWDYTLSNTDPISINKVDGVGQKVITRTLTSGTPSASTISLSGIPSGVTAAIANNSCTPTCNSTITFTVNASAPNGASPITVTSQPGSKTMNFNLIITGNAMNVTCVPDPAVAMIGQPVTWTAKATNGNPPYTYSWSGSGIPTSPAPTVNPYTVTYSTIGQKMISAEVTDSLGEKSSCPANSSVWIKFDPQFEEF